MGYVFEQVQATGQHTKDCHFEDMVLEHEIKSGLSSIFVFRCDVCGIKTRVQTDRKTRTAMGINRDAVLGTTCVCIEEFCANMDVPPQSTVYSEIRRKISRNIFSSWRNKNL